MRSVQQRPDPALVILITAFASMELTLDAIRLGAYDFLTKPFQLEELQLVVRNAAEKLALAREAAALRARNAQLESTIQDLQHQQEQLNSRVEQMIEELHRSGLVEAHAGVGHVVLADPTRRRYQEQLGAYLKQSRSVVASAHAGLAQEPDETLAPLDSPTSTVEA
jgi:two-component system response regulator PilR (NtrC family)